MKLTKGRIDGFKYEGDGKSRDVRWDDDISGHGLRIYPSGRKAFVLSYRLHGRKRLMQLGQYGPLTLDMARNIALKRKAEVIDGSDPLEKRQAAAGAGTMRDLSRVYMERYGIRKRSARDDQRRIEQHILPRWANHKAEGLKRAEIAEAHHKVGQDHPYEANRRLALLRRMLNLARHWGFVDEGWPNPAAGIPMHPEQSRDRWVTHDELPRLAKSIDQEPNVYVRCALWLYLLTGMRKSELLRATWEDIDWDRKELRLGTTKAGRPHYMPLSPPAVAILQTIPRQEGNPFILCGARRGQHLVNISKPWFRVRARAGRPDAREIVGGAVKAGWTD